MILDRPVIGDVVVPVGKRGPEMLVVDFGPGVAADRVVCAWPRRGYRAVTELNVRIIGLTRVRSPRS